jgi:MFS family permease
MNDVTTEQQTPHNQTSTTPASLLGVKVVLLYACTLTTMSIATISPSLPRIAAAFREIPNVEFLTKLLLAIPAVFIALGAPLAGLIVDKGHRKTLLVWSLGLYALAGTSGLYLPTLFHLLVARSFLGLAIAGIMTAAQTLIADYFEGEERNRMMGLQGAFTALGGVVFIALAGFLADFDAAHHLTEGAWRMPFWLYAASLPLVPAALALLKATTMQDDTPQDTPQNAPQSVSQSRSEEHLENAMSNPKAQQYAPQRTDQLSFASVIGIICGTTLLGMAMYYTIPTQFPFFLNGLGVAQSARIGLAISTANLIGGIASLLMPVLKRRMSFSRISLVAFVAFAVGFSALSQSTNYVQAFLCVLFCGFGVGLLMPTMKLWTMNLASLATRGKAIGAMTAAMFFGQFASPILTQPLVAAQGLSVMYETLGCIALVGVAFFAALKIERSK